MHVDIMLNSIISRVVYRAGGQTRPCCDPAARVDLTTPHFGISHGHLHVHRRLLYCAHMDWSELLNHKRRRPTTIPQDPRSEFERDFDRAVFATPVKRLQDKAQVFPLEPHDAVRTRLTHSLEVSSVARGLATRSAKWLWGQGLISEGMDRSIEAIAATCGLIHDLGNPPFGHAGEDAIRAWFEKPKQANLMAGLNHQQTQDFLRFEGNAQSLRLVAKLQILADDTGLNLTLGTLSALSKYIASS